MDRIEPKYPEELVRVAQECDTLDELASYVELDEEACLSRAELRSLMIYAKSERFSDEVAPTPDSTDPLTRKIDGNLNMVIDAITAENIVLNKMAKQPAGTTMMLKSTGKMMNPQEAKQQLMENTKYLLEIKKSLNEQKKADPSSLVTLNVDLRSVVSDALTNIKAMECI